MKQRGKKSAASLSVVQAAAPQRPAAPDDLLPSEKEVFAAIVGARSVSFFDDASIPLLVEYCRLMTQVNLLGQQLNDFLPEWLLTDEGVKRYKNLTAIRDQGQGRMIALARSLRLTQQSRYVPDSAKNRPRDQKAPERLWQRPD